MRRFGEVADMQMNNTLRFNHQLRLHHKARGTAILTGRHLQNITTVFRAVEFLVFLAVISRFSLMLPIALKLSGDYFRDLAVTLVSPRFVFVVGNAIVITLFLKSGGKLSHPNHNPETYPAAFGGAVSQPETTFIVSVYSSAAKTVDGCKSPAAAEVKIKCYQRSKSEKMYVKRTEKPAGERKSGNGGGRAEVLRRTKTERLERRVGCTCERHAYEGHYPEDHMSSEEFRQTIEDFIARQQRFLKEEEEEEIFAVAG